MKIMYIGKKRGIHLTFAWLAMAVMMVPRKPVEIDDNDGLRLITDYPETFCEFKEDPLEKFIRENTVPEKTTVPGNDIEFDQKDGKFLCPFCQKDYAANPAGKRFLIKHIEKDHAEAWAAALTAEKANLENKEKTVFSESGADGED